MKLLSYFVLTAVLLSIGAPAVVAQEAVDPWGEQVAPGIEYREYRLPAPNNVFVTRMERDNPLVTIESSIGQGRLSGGTETVKGMTQRYDGAINYWDQNWGNRNKVVAAINGFYFDYSTGIPRQGQVHSGWYSKLFDPCETGTGGSGFAWKLDRNVFIGESVRNPVNEIHYFRDDVLINNESNLGTNSLENIVYLPLVINIIGVLPEPKQVFDGINVERGQDQLILYTSQYGKDTGTDKTDSIEVLVRMTSPSLIRDSKDEDFFPIGIIERIFENRGSTQIPFDHVVLSMHGVKKDEFLTIRAEVGDEIGILQMIKGCNDAPDFSWENTYASIGGAFYFLKDGVINDFSDKGEAKVRDPRTAIAFNDDYIFFIVVDGRDEWYSKGMSIEELAMFTRDELGATHGIAEDGGGSSTMVVNGEVKNNTYCNIVICKGEIYLPLITAAGTNKQSEISPSTGILIPRFPASSSPQPERLSGDGLPLTEEYYTSGQDASRPQLQRLVANGMMMVVVEPKDLSSIFTVDDKIKTLTPVNVRLGPGTNYPSIETIPADITGVIYGFDNGLNGVWAKDYYWWRVLLEIDGRDVIGWVIEPALTPFIP
ncbi:phosphodiester glycosidase family protein [Chloroflexota bacterium]